MTSTTNWQPRWIDYLSRKGRIQQLAELTAVQDMRAKAAENQRNSEAEAAHVRRSVWGESPGQNGSSSDSSDMSSTGSDMGMGNTILGDINQPQPPTVVVTGGNSQQSMWPAAALALAAMLPVAGIGAAGAGAAAMYYFNQPEAKVEQPIAPTLEYEDQSVSIGLGRLDDE
jgi:sugar (pentulose or hexulose) kinase